MKPKHDCLDFINMLQDPSKLDKGYAGALYQQIVKEIKAFESTLDDTHEVGMRLVHFGDSMQFHVTAIKYINPYLLLFFGHLDDGSPVELIQHISQLSFLIVKLKRLHPEKPKRPIGFLD